jgi:iron complex outermembrane receptor protein
MNKKISISMICACALSLYGADLGKISVESTTIDDRFEAKKTEVSNTSVISGDVVDKAHIENIQQILQSIPGLTTEIQTGDSLKLHIRGVENQRYMGEKPGVAVVIDGVPVFERTGKVNIDLDNIESIKVVKGGASYLFGEDALSGAVIITTKKGAKNSYNSVGLEAGSFGYQKLLARAGYANDKVNLYLQGSQRKSDGYHENSDYDTKYLNSKVQYYIDESSDITAGLELSKRNKDSHGTVKGVTEAATNPQSIYNGTGDRDYSRKYDVDLAKYFVTYAKDLSDNSNFLFNIYQYNDDTNYESSPIKYSLTGASVTSEDAYSTYNDLFQIQRGAKSEYRTQSDTVATLLGVDLRANYYENKTNIQQDYCSALNYFPTKSCKTIVTAGTITGDDETDENVMALYGELKYAVSNDFAVTTNARYDHISYDYNDKLKNVKIDKSFDVGSYRLGGTYALDEKSSFYSNISTGFRTPSVSQMFAGDIDPTSTKVESNHDLKPEVSYNYEIGVRGANSLFEYDAALFLIDRDDYIMANVGQYASTDPSSPLYTKTKYENIGGMRNKGLELALNTDKKKTVYFDVAYSYTDAKFTQYDNFNLTLGNSYGTYKTPATFTNPATQYTIEHYNLTGNYIPRVPKHNLNLRTNYNYSDNLLLTAEVNAKSKYYADEMNRIEIGGQALLNLMASYATKISGYKFDFFAKVDNALDKFYYNTARASGDGNTDGKFDAEDLSITVNQGRTYTAGLSMKF